MLDGRAIAIIAALCLGLSITSISAWAEGTSESDLAQCWSCHGLTGRSNDLTMPVIWGQNADYIAKQLNDYRDGSRDSQIMSSMAEAVPRSKLGDVAKFISLKTWPNSAQLALKTPLSDLAQSCTACHGADLKGGQADTGHAPRLAGQNERYLIEQMQAFTTGLRANFPLMTSIMREINAAQREALARELASFTP